MKKRNKIRVLKNLRNISCLTKTSDKCIKKNEDSNKENSMKKNKN